MEEESKLEVVLDIEMASDLDDPWCLTSPAMPAPFSGHGIATPQANQRCCQWQTKARRNLRKIKQISTNDKTDKPTQYALLNDILEKSSTGSGGPPKPEVRPKSGPACKRKAKRKRKLTSANLPRKKKRKKTSIDIEEIREYFGYTVDASGGVGVKNSDPCAIHDVVSHSTGGDAVCVSDDEETEITTLQTGALVDSKHNSVMENLDVRTVAFPTRDDPDAVEVHVSDLNYLQDLVYLNDTVIDFHIKYIQVSNIEPERKQMFHFYNSFFFKQLVEFVCATSSLVDKNKIVKLRKWTKGVDIFQKPYLILPVHHGFHWSLAIVCFTEAFIGHESSPTCYILHLDSMQIGHKTNYIYEVIRRYLIAEWDSHKQAGDASHKMATDNVLNAPGEKEKNTPTVLMKRIMVPRQENEFDCGLFLLHFIELFVKEAPPRLNPDSTKHMFGKQWFKPLEASSLRILIRQRIERLLQGNER